MHPPHSKTRRLAPRPLEILAILSLLGLPAEALACGGAPLSGSGGGGLYAFFVFFLLAALFLFGVLLLCFLDGLRNLACPKREARSPCSGPRLSSAADLAHLPAFSSFEPPSPAKARCEPPLAPAERSKASYKALPKEAGGQETRGSRKDWAAASPRPRTNIRPLVYWPAFLLSSMAVLGSHGTIFLMPFVTYRGLRQMGMPSWVRAS